MSNELEDRLAELMANARSAVPPIVSSQQVLADLQAGKIRELRAYNALEVAIAQRDEYGDALAGEYGGKHSPGMNGDNAAVLAKLTGQPQPQPPSVKRIPVVGEKYFIGNKQRFRKGQLVLSGAGRVCIIIAEPKAPNGAYLVEDVITERQEYRFPAELKLIADPADDLYPALAEMYMLARVQAMMTGEE